MKVTAHWLKDQRPATWHTEVEDRRGYAGENDNPRRSSWLWEIEL